MQMENNNKSWHLFEFTRELAGRFSQKTGQTENVHYNTISNWFNALEDQGIHFVKKVEDTRVFDNHDMQIALAIMEMRKNKLPLNVIFTVLPEKIGVRIQEAQVKKRESVNVDEKELKELLIEKIEIFYREANKKNENIMKYFEINNEMNSLTSKKQSLIIEKTNLENKIDIIGNKIETLEIRKDFYEFKKLKNEVDEVSKTKNKNFLARLFSGQSQPATTENSESSPGDTEKIKELDKLTTDLLKEKAHILEEIKVKTSEIENISEDIKNNYSKRLEEAKELLLIEYQEEENIEGETVI